MIRSAATRLSRRVSSSSSSRVMSRRLFSGNPLEADTGALATHAYHTLNLSLCLTTPLYFLLPESVTDGMFGKAFGVLLAGTMSAHSWIGLNYVATDYVPKLSKALLGPSRIVIAGLAGVTFLGLSRMSIQSPGGIKGTVKGIWNPTPAKDEKK